MKEKKKCAGEIFRVFFDKIGLKRVSIMWIKKFNSATTPVLRVKIFNADGAFLKFQLDEFACLKKKSAKLRLL